MVKKNKNVFKCYIKCFKINGEMFNFVRESIGTESTELKKLVMISLSISHGQGGVERGFGDTKRIVSDRLSLNDVSVKGLKTVGETVNNFAPIASSLLNNMKHACSLKMQEEQ